MAKYVDGFVLVVPKGKEAEYQKMAEMGRDSWMKHDGTDPEVAAFVFSHGANGVVLVV